MLEKFSLEYDDNLPKDYDISKIQVTFDFIKLVLKDNVNINNAIEDISNEYNLKKTDLIEYLVENKFILNKTNIQEFSNKIKKYNTKSLKKILKKNGLKTSGKRKRIEKRIFENIFLPKNYSLSSKSKIFYKNKKRRIRIFNEYLTDYYYFREFNDYYMDSYRKREYKIPIDFINLFIEKATDKESHEMYILNNQIMSEYYFAKDKYQKMLEYELKIFCMNLNPVWKIDDLKNHTGILKDNYDNLNFLKEQLSKNITINAFYWVWDSFEFEKIIVSKYDGYRYLKDILNFKELNRINEDLNKRFYQNEDLKIKKITQKTLFDF